MSYSILYLVPDLIGPPGGIARYCRLVCRALMETGAALRTIALCDSESAGPEAAEMFPSMPYWPCRGSRPVMVSRALSETIRRRPSLVLVGHANFSPVGWVVARLSGARMVTFAYGVDVWRKLLAERCWAFRRSDQVISISRFTADRAVLANGIAPNKVRILYNCLDPRFEGYARAEGAGSGLSMLTVGRMTLAEQYKGHDYVIRSMPVLLRQFPHLVYDIVGDGDGRPSLERLADQVGVREAVRFHGVVSEAELQRRYAQASLFIMPSRGEGFGFVFLEAMAHGVPAIGGSMDGTAEIILDGETGYLVDPTSEEAISAAASRLLANDALRKRMGKTAWRRANQDFGYTAFRMRLANLLGELHPVDRDPRGRG